MKDPDPPSSELDVALLCGPTQDGQGLGILRARQGRLESGEVRPLVEGRALAAGAEVVRLHPRPGQPRVCDVQVQVTVPAPPPATNGPPRVATPAYRDHWEHTFRRAPATDPTLN